MKNAHQKLSLTKRLILTASVVSFGALFLVGIILSAIFRSSIENSFDRQLAVNLDALSASVELKNGELSVQRPPSDARFSRPLSGYYWQVTNLNQGNEGKFGVKSHSLFDEELIAPNSLIINTRANMGKTVSINISRADEHLRLAARVIKLPENQFPILLMVTGDIDEIEISTRYFNRILIASLVTLAFGFILANYLQVKIGLSPLRKMGRELVDIREGRDQNLDENIAIELSPIAKEINALLTHNQEVVERAKTHVGNLAHALKTPLSVMLNEAKENNNPFGELVSAQAQTMTRQVEHYLKRAQAAARAESLRSRTNVQNVVDDLVRTLNRLYRNDGVKIEVLGVTNAIFRGDREDLEDLIGNLTENACKYGGGLVEISFKEADGQIEIIIDDDGDGLTNAQISAALRRGVRLDETHHGSGLGLNIADELARAYNGSLLLENSPLGGLRVRLNLPVASV